LVRLAAWSSLFGAQRRVLADLPVAERNQTWKEVGEALSQFEGLNGFKAPSELLVGAGTR
jgi:hypothetical protein